MGMPRTETEFEFDMVFCFDIHFTPYAVFLFIFFNRNYLQHIAQPVEGDRPINIVFVRPSVLPKSVYECRVITLQPLAIDLCNLKEMSQKDLSHQDHVELTKTITLTFYC